LVTLLSSHSLYNTAPLSPTRSLALTVSSVTQVGATSTTPHNRPLDGAAGGDGGKGFDGADEGLALVEDAIGVGETVTPELGWRVDDHPSDHN
jgi:hypothetical protein